MPTARAPTRVGGGLKQPPYSSLAQRSCNALLTRKILVRIRGEELVLMISLSEFVCMSQNSVRVIRCRKDLKRKAIAYLGGSCQKCGYSKCIEALEFHHRDPTQKEFSLGVRGLYRSFERVRVELDKCDLLCANCHREIHAELVSNLTPIQKMGKPHVPWPTTEELSFWVQKETLISIANRLNVNRVTVRYWCAVLGVTLPNHGSRLPGAIKPTRKNPTLWPNTDVLASMVTRKPILQLAKDFGVSETAVRKRCKLLGIQTKPQGYWAQQEALVSAEARFPPVSELRIKVSTTSYKRVARELGCDPRTLRNYILRKAA